VARLQERLEQIRRPAIRTGFGHATKSQSAYWLPP
jgi:hypothetical protein